MDNVRLSIDIQGLKEMLWGKADGTNLEELMPEDVAGNPFRWIDTSCMLVDCLTKRMDPMAMINSMENGLLSLGANAESKLLKMRKAVLH